MRRRALSRLGSVALAAAVAGAGCSRAGGGAAAEERAHGRPPVAVELASVSVHDLTDGVEVVGSLVPKFEAEVKSEYSGILTGVYVTEWVHVRKGTPLARLDDTEVTTALEGVKAALLQATVNETRAVRELERAGSLKEFGLVTQQQLDDARTAREAAAAMTAAARAQLKAVETRLGKTVIRSPLDGVVSFRGVNVGDRVENMGGSTPMFTIVDPRLLQATLSVPSAHLAAVVVGQAFEFTVDGLPGRQFEGRVNVINPTVDPVTRAARVVVDVPNPDGMLKGGLFVRGRIVTGRRAGVLRVPRSALVNWDAGGAAADVFVVVGEAAARRRVRTGAASGELVEIGEGLEPGDRVVTRGAFNLRDGDKLAIGGAKGV